MAQSFELKSKSKAKKSTKTVSAAVKEGEYLPKGQRNLAANRTMQAIEIIKSDKRFQRLERNFNDLPYFNLPITQLSAEIESLHRLRSIRKLNPQSPTFIDDVIKAANYDQSVRSRLTEMMLGAFKAEKSLSAAISALKEYLLVRYAEDLAFIRTKSERSAVIDIALHSFVKYVKKVQSLQDEAKIVIEDIDKAGYLVKNFGEILKLVHKPERN
jgi:hypothetical protein